MQSDKEFGYGAMIGSVLFGAYVIYLFRKGELSYRGVRYSKKETKIPFYFMVVFMLVLALIGFLCGVSALYVSGE